MTLPGRPSWLGVLLIMPLVAPAQVLGQGAAGQIVELRTRDGVQLVITYYPASVHLGLPAAKQVTPVVMLHDHKDTRAIFGPLAALLLKRDEDDRDAPSFAVATADLRGHGDSTRQNFPDGTEQGLDSAKISKEDVYRMAYTDMEEIRRFLVTKNDEGALNLNKLCLVGCGMGANVAANWAAEDWRVEPLAVGKQGQDVKALVLISPSSSFLGLSMQAPMQLRPLKQLAAWMLVYGADDPKAAGNIRRLEKQLKTFHPDTDANGAPRPNDLLVLGLPSKLQGDRLLTQLGDTVNPRIRDFLLEHVAQKKLPWTARRVRSQ